jgi:APA family basic amino acid/polyamine antiporter
MTSPITTPTMPKSFWGRLFQTVPVQTLLNQCEAQEHQLKKTLTAFDLVVLGVGALIGAGIFVLTGSAAAGSPGHLAAGPALTLSFLITGFICCFCALCYAEFAAMVPISGSAYTYALSSMGEWVAWIIAWALVLEYAVGNMAVAVGLVGSIKALLQSFHMALPTWFTGNTLDTALTLKDASPEILVKAIPFTIPFANEQMLLLVQKAFNIPAFISVCVVSALLYIGISESVRAATLMVLMKTTIVLLFIGVGAAFLLNGHMDMLHTNWFADGWHTFAPNGTAGIVAGAATIFFAYVGFDAVSTAAEETKNPQRDIPIGILGSLLICTVLYVLVTAVITAIVPLDQINKEAAVAGALNLMGQGWASILINLGAITGLASVLLVFQMGGARILYAVARDGLLPHSMSKIHPKFKTPYIATIVMGLFTAFGSGLLPINLLAEMCNVGTLGAFIVVCIGVAILRFTDPDRHRAFRAPFGITMPIIGSLGCIYVMTGLPSVTWVVAIGWFILGLAIYFGYGYWHSRISQKNLA